MLVTSRDFPQNPGEKTQSGLETPLARAITAQIDRNHPDMVNLQMGHV